MSHLNNEVCHYYFFFSDHFARIIMSISQERLEELEVIRTKLNVKFDMVSSMIDKWLPPKDPEEEAKEEEAERERQEKLTQSIRERHAER